MAEEARREEMKVEPVYLGDGVYATFNGFSIELRLGAHTNPPVVVLEQREMNALVQFARQCGMKIVA